MQIVDRIERKQIGDGFKRVAVCLCSKCGAETNEAADLALAELASLKAEADKHSQEALALATAFETLSARIDKIIGPKKTS